MPFEGSSAEAVAKILAPEPVPPLVRPDVPPALAAAVLRALEKDPARRFPSMGALAEALAPFARKTPQVMEALDEIANTTPTAASSVQRKEQKVETVEKPRSSRTRLAFTGAGLLLVVVIVGLVGWRRSISRSPDPVSMPQSPPTSAEVPSAASSFTAVDTPPPTSSSPPSSVSARRDPPRRTLLPTATPRSPHAPTNAPENPARL
jgi:serine/threonine-protein kinase